MIWTLILSFSGLMIFGVPIAVMLIAVTAIVVNANDGKDSHYDFDITPGVPVNFSAMLEANARCYGCDVDYEAIVMRAQAEAADADPVDDDAHTQQHGKLRDPGSRAGGVCVHSGSSGAACGSESIGTPVLSDSAISSARLSRTGRRWGLRVELWPYSWVSL